MINICYILPLNIISIIREQGRECDIWQSGNVDENVSQRRQQRAIGPDIWLRKVQCQSQIEFGTQLLSLLFSINTLDV